jgi:hypothetical protein
MSLPLLETPNYELTLPSTGKKIKYRPFLVKEYKILLTSMDADVTEISRIVTELVDACTFKELDIKKLASFDIEYIFLNIRARSISETTDIFVNCVCGEKIDHTIDLTKIEVDMGNQPDSKIMLSDDIGVVMRYPKFNETLEIYENINSEKVLKLVCECVDAVFTKKDYFDRSSFSELELQDFVESFTKKQFDKLEEFFQHLPKIVHHIEADCPACGKTNKVDLEGLQNFFV